MQSQRIDFQAVRDSLGANSSILVLSLRERRKQQLVTYPYSCSLLIFSSLLKLCTILILVHNFFVFQVEETCCCCLRRPRWLFRLGGATKAIHSIVKPCWREVAPPVALVRTSAFPRVTRANQRFVSNTIPIPSSKDCISVFEGSKSFATNDWCSRGLLVWMVAGRHKTGQTDGPTKRAAGAAAAAPRALASAETGESESLAGDERKEC